MLSSSTWNNLTALQNAYRAVFEDRNTQIETLQEQILDLKDDKKALKKSEAKLKDKIEDLEAELETVDRKSVV